MSDQDRTHDDVPAAGGWGSIQSVAGIFTQGDLPLLATIYGFDDRFRDVVDTRMVVLMKPEDIQAHQLTEGQRIPLEATVAIRSNTVYPVLKPAGSIFQRGAIRGIFRRLTH